MTIATISSFCIIIVLIFMFRKIEKDRKGKSIVNYYIKPGLIGGFLGIFAIILRISISMIFSLLFTKGESFNKIITDVINIKAISMVLMMGFLIGILVAVSLEGK